MRHPKYRLAEQRALEILKRAPAVHLATTTPEGKPVLRTLDAAVLRDHIVFHGALAGEKALALGRAAVVSADETVASIPSYFVDKERACPATTLYESVQIHGRLEAVDGPERKAEALSALMRKYQPEGGYAPLDADSPLYARALAGVLVFGVRLERISGKAKLAQNRTPDERRHILECLWARGAPGDARAIARILEGNPELALPELFIGPHAVRLEPALDERDLEAVLDLLSDQYWTHGISRELLARSHLASPAWVGARTPSGMLVASAHAISDGAKLAYVMDVVVAREHRGLGIGSALLHFLMDHPAVRAAQQVRLGTADSQAFYRRLGFVELDQLDRGFDTTWMVRERGETNPTPPGSPS